MAHDSGTFYLGSGDIPYPARVGNLYAKQVLTSANGTTSVTLFTGSPGYFITECGMQVDPVAFIAVAGMVTMKFTDSVFGDFFVIRWYILNSGNPTQNTNARVTNGPGFYWSAKNANSTVSVSTDTALTSGSVRFFARYGLTNIIG